MGLAEGNADWWSFPSFFTSFSLSHVHGIFKLSVAPPRELFLFVKSRQDEEAINYEQYGVGGRGESGSSNNWKVSGSIPALTAQRLVN